MRVRDPRVCAKRPRRKIWTSASEVESKPREAYPLSEKKEGNLEGEAQAVDSEEELQLSPTLCSPFILTFRLCTLT